MRTFTFITTLLLELSLCTLAATAQTEYRIDQRLPGDIEKIRVYDGWNVRLVHDTVNYISIVTPCEYYFAEGNEPQICRQHSDGWFSLWKNTSMPQGTLVEVHYRHSLRQLDVYPGATVGCDTLLMIDTVSYGDINVRRGATLRVDELRCRREIGKRGFLSIDADTAATVHIGTVRAGYLMLWSRQESTLMLDSIDALKVDYRRDPLAHDNLWNSIPDRNIKVSTRNRWFMKGFKQLDNTIDLAISAPFEQRYNNPLASDYSLTVIDGLNTNVIPMNRHLGLSLAVNFGISFSGLQNNVTHTGQTLVLDTVNPGVNRKHTLTQYYLGLPVKVHYLPGGGFAKSFFNDLHIGLEPRWYFLQRYYGIHYTESQVRPSDQTGNGFFDFGQKANVCNPLQLRAEIGCRINPFSNVEFNFFVDLLPTYRRETGMGGVHTFGLQIRY